MPAKEIKELRKEGRLEEALEMAENELDTDPNGIWPKRNISWVYLDYLKAYSNEEYQHFRNILGRIIALELPAGEGLFYEQFNWTIGKYIFGLCKDFNNVALSLKNSIYIKVWTIFQDIKNLPLSRKNASYSFLFKSFHKTLKEYSVYTQCVDFFGIDNFIPEDYQKEKLTDGKEIMSLVEQVYIAYAKGLLPKEVNGEVNFDREKASLFQAKLVTLCEEHPEYQYPPYFNAKLLLSLGNDEQAALNALLPFARKKRSEFWVWELLAEVFKSDNEKYFACYCKALTCKSQDEMLVGIRQKMAGILIAKKEFDAAKTEIDTLVETRTRKSFKIPPEVESWKNQKWYIKSENKKSNVNLYKQYISIADGILFEDIPEESIIVEFVNRDKKILNFIASDTKYGFLKYDRFFSEVKIGDVLKVRFQGGSNNGMHQLYTAIKSENDAFKNNYFKIVKGKIKIPDGKSFGFLEDAFIHPSIVTKNNLTDGKQFSGAAIKTFNQEKKQWGWKMF